MGHCILVTAKVAAWKQGSCGEVCTERVEAHPWVHATVLLTSQCYIAKVSAAACKRSTTCSLGDVDRSLRQLYMAPYRWLLPLLVLVTALKLLSRYYTNMQPTLAYYNQEPRTSHSSKQQMYYFFNEITGATQWTDPGDTPYEDEMTGERYYLDANGKRTSSNLASYQYTWVEYYNEQQKKPYFYNQETQQTVWERPVDLAWRRIKLKDFT